MKPDIIFSQENDNYELFVFPTGQLETNSTWLINKVTKETVIFDPGHDPQLSFSFIESKNLNPIAYLHTHAHFDHAVSTKMLSDKFPAPIYLHRGDHSLYHGMPESGLRYGIQLPAPNPITTFLEDGQTLFGFKVLYTPGHTLGGVCFYSEQFSTPILIAGDTIFQGSIGRTDLDGGSYPQIIGSIKQKIFTLRSETSLICGHGPKTTVDFEIKNNPFFN